MSHITGIIQTLGAPLTIGPGSGSPPTSPNVWAIDFAHTPAPGGTKLLILHFRNVTLPGANRLEVDLGYDIDVFTSADGGEFWTRPVNVHAFAVGQRPYHATSPVERPAGSAQTRQVWAGRTACRRAGAPLDLQ